MMNSKIENYLLRLSEATAISSSSLIQRLWSNYGQILRVQLLNGNYASVVIKLVQLPKLAQHPRDWNTDIGHQRKVKSYQVEAHWYSDFAQDCNANCRVPNCLGIQKIGEELVIVLEDLNASGFPLRKSSANSSAIKACISWLAYFHARFMHREATGLWEKGTYWQLDTRPDELAVLEDLPLKRAAAGIDAQLQSARFKTLVHGDAKLANFCFSQDGISVAAVDFQYVGAGCGMKDLVYFMGSCLSEKELENQSSTWLNYYFNCLEKALEDTDLPFQALEEEWRSLQPFAVADFHRFMKGWSPGHWKLNSYSERITRSVVQQILNH